MHSKPKIKICGITRLEDALLAQALGADALGFNFYGKSQRFIDPADAKKIASALQSESHKLLPIPCLVGVFVDAPRQEVIAIAKEVGLTCLQFHGSETKEFCSGWPDFKVIRALRVSADLSVADMLSIESSVSRLLLDRYENNLAGGTGKTIPNDILARLQVDGFLERAILAGGLNADNVVDRIRTYRPYGLDVASGIESAPGCKDKNKMELFIQRIRDST